LSSFGPPKEENIRAPRLTSAGDNIEEKEGPQKYMNSPFWSMEELDLDDSLNKEIWRDSPREQEQIQPYRADWHAGAIGAQQAMRHPYRLRWVPDPVGRDWKSRDALFIFGSAYGPFVGGGDRPHEIDPTDYDCRSSAEFLERFLKSVVITRLYYTRVAELASTVVPSCRLLAPVDLCRVAFVRRDVSRDRGGDRVANSAPELFSAFVESRAASDWLWRRLVDSEASALIALGTVAEHGLLRLFARHLQKCSIRDSQDVTIRFSAKDGDLKWPSRYAHRLRKLEDRQRARVPPFWEIEGEVAGGAWRTWRLAVIPHPTGAWAQRSGYSAIAVRAVYRPAR
jgi:hypothetical protein